MSLPTWETDLFSLAPEPPPPPPSVNTLGGCQPLPQEVVQGVLPSVKWETSARRDPEGPARPLAAPRPADVTFLFVFLEPGRANSC